MKPSRRSGFTLVEILIVVVIMGILASIIIPQFAQSSDDARYSSTIQNLQTLRSQVDLYRNQHENRYPGNPAGAADDTDFVEQMVFPTNGAGGRASPPDKGFGDTKFPFGPYVTNRLSPNPFNGSRIVKTVTNGNFGAAPTTPPAATDPGWIYDVTSGRIKINKDGKTPDGKQNYWDL